MIPVRVDNIEGGEMFGPEIRIFGPILDEVEEGVEIGGGVGIDRMIPDKLSKEIERCFGDGDILVVLRLR